MQLLTSNGWKLVTKKTPCTSQKTGKTVWLYQTDIGTFISTKKLRTGANVRHALTDAFG